MNSSLNPNQKASPEMDLRLLEAEASLQRATGDAPIFGSITLTLIYRDSHITRFQVETKKSVSFDEQNSDVEAEEICG